jgi:hypothetical protein
MAAERYTYEPLNYSTQSIRLIKIDSDAKEDRLSCSIKTAPVDTEYVCVSYCWGPQSSNQILLNGQTANIRDNIFAFLQQALVAGLRDWLWIDALSIDQSNDEERSHQVGQMAKIYRGAQYVVMWLGSFDAVAKVFEHTGRGAAGSGVTRALWQLESMLDDETIRDDQGLEAYQSVIDERHWNLYEFLGRLCAADYWNRVWVVQEILLARQATLWWGSEVFAWRPLRVLIALAQREVEQRPDEYSETIIDLKTPRVAKLGEQIFGDDSETGLDLIVLLEWLGDMECADPRDRIYALLSLSRNGTEIAVDYGEDLTSLVLRVGRHYALKAGPQYRSEAWLEICHRLASVLPLSRPPSWEDISSENSLWCRKRTYPHPMVIGMQDTDEDIHRRPFYRVWVVDNNETSSRAISRAISRQTFASSWQHEICDDCRVLINANSSVRLISTAELFKVGDGKPSIFFKSTIVTSMGELLTGFRALHVTRHGPRHLSVDIALDVAMKEHKGVLFLLAFGLDSVMPPYSPYAALLPACGRSDCLQPIDLSERD